MSARTLSVRWAISAFCVVMLALIALVAAAPAGALTRTGTGPWFWENRLPQGDCLHDVCFSTASNAWAVGDSGVVIASTDSGVTWALRPIGTTRDLYCVAFADAQHGWIGGDNGVLFTADGGATWTAQNAGSIAVRDVVITGSGSWDTRTIVAVGAAGKIARTTNGGATWTQPASGTTYVLRSVAFGDDSTGWATGDYRTILKTADGGATWTPQTYSSAAPTESWDVLGAVTARSATTAWIGSSQARVLCTTDGGTTWNVISAPYLSASVDDLAFVSDTQGYALAHGNDGWTDTTSLWKTTDGGTTWTWTSPLYSTTEFGLQAFQLLGAGGACAVGSAGAIVTSPDMTTWTQRTTGSGSAINDISITPTGHGWAVGANGTILRTSDGVTWTVQRSKTSMERVDCVTAISDTEAFAAGNATALMLHTIDGGTTWNAQPVPGSIMEINDLAMVNGTTGWAVGASGAVIHTTDGSTWSAQDAGVPADTQHGLYGIDAVDGQRAWLVGAQGVIRCTTDGGGTWSIQSPPAAKATTSLWDVDFVSSLEGWAVGDNSTLLRTTDGGATWVSVNVGSVGTLESVRFDSVKEGWIAGVTGVVLHTTDGGSTWSTEDVGTHEMLTTIALAGGTVWVAGREGVVLVRDMPRTTDDAPAEGAWMKSLPITLTPSDIVSGVVGTQYSVDGAPAVSGTIVPALSEGVHSLTYWSTNGAGISESPVTRSIRVDRTKPTAGFALPSAVTWIKSTPIPITAADGLSGIGSVWYSLDGGSPMSGTSVPALPEGQHTISAWAIDNVGNSSDTAVRTLRVDGSAPVISFDLPSTVKWMKPGPLTFDATDGLSGLASAWYSVDGGPAMSGTTIPAPADGLHKIAAWGIDNVGNSGAASAAVRTLGYDGKRPTPKVLAAASVKHGKKVTLRFRINDTLPGCGTADVTITIKTLKGKALRAPKLLSGRAENAGLTYAFICKLKPGAYRFWVAATDAAGNKGTKIARGSLRVI